MANEKKGDVGSELAVMAQGSLAEFNVKNPQEAVKKLLEDGGELATQFVKLEEGDWLQGLYEGFGEDHVFHEVDKKTGEVTDRPSRTIIVRSHSGKATVRLMGNYELVQKLQDLPKGSNVVITRGAMKSVNTQNGIRQVSEFQVVCKRAKSAITAQE